MLSSPTIGAVARLLDLLTRSSPTRALEIVMSSSRYSDLSQSQYFEAMQLILSAANGGAQRNRFDFPLDLHTHGRSLFEQFILIQDPAWLSVLEADQTSAEELPEEAVEWGNAFRLDSGAVLEVFRQRQGRADYQALAELGAWGEEQILAWLSELEESSVEHIAAEHDGYGYDILWRWRGSTYYLEIKTIAKAVAPRFFISRQESRAASALSEWRLMLVPRTAKALDGVLEVPKRELVRCLPIDQGKTVSWESAKVALRQDQVTRPFSQHVRS